MGAQRIPNDWHFPQIVKLRNGRATNMKYALLLMALWAIGSVGRETASQAQERNLQEQSGIGKKTEIGTAVQQFRTACRLRWVRGWRQGLLLAQTQGPSWSTSPQAERCSSTRRERTPRHGGNRGGLNVMARVLEKTVVQQVKSARCGSWA